MRRQSGRNGHRPVISYMTILGIHLVNPVEDALDIRGVFRDGMTTIQVLIGREPDPSTILVWQALGDQDEREETSCTSFIDKADCGQGGRGAVGQSRSSRCLRRTSPNPPMNGAPRTNLRCSSRKTMALSAIGDLQLDRPSDSELTRKTLYPLRF